MPLSPVFLKMLKQRNSKRDGTLKKLKVPPKWFYPAATERQYIAYLYRYTLKIREKVMEIVVPRIPEFMREGTYDYPDPIKPRLDSFIDDINRSIEEVNVELIPAQQTVIKNAELVGREIATYNTVQFLKTTKSVLGIDVFASQPWLLEQLELFANQNAQLIKNLTENEMNRVSGAIQRGIQEGSTYKSVAEDIEQSFGITRRHARLIARDQTAKLNASITKLQQQQIGVSTYRWDTVNDERVRASHAVMNGLLMRWDDPTVYFNESSGKWEKRTNIGGDPHHPAVSIMCRCLAIPVIEGIFDAKI